MPNYITEDQTEQALLQKLQHLHGYDVLECGTSDPEDLAYGSGHRQALAEPGAGETLAIAKKGKTWDLSKIDFEKLRQDFRQPSTATSRSPASAPLWRRSSARCFAKMPAAPASSSACTPSSRTTTPAAYPTRATSRNS